MRAQAIATLAAATLTALVAADGEDVKCSYKNKLMFRRGFPIWAREEVCTASTTTSAPCESSTITTTTTITAYTTAIPDDCTSSDEPVEVTPTPIVSTCTTDASSPLSTTDVSTPSSVPPPAPPAPPAPGTTATDGAYGVPSEAPVPPPPATPATTPDPAADTNTPTAPASITTLATADATGTFLTLTTSRPLANSTSSAVSPTDSVVASSAGRVIMMGSSFLFAFAAVMCVML